MQKLFRFKYEPCNGMCYAWCDKLTTELLKLTVGNRQALVATMTKAHDRLCDNPNYSFGVDVDAAGTTFVAHFRTPEKTDLYSSKDFVNVVSMVCTEVMKADIPQIKGDCVYGANGAEDLGREILRACEDIAYREEHHNNCPCKHTALPG